MRLQESELGGTDHMARMRRRRHRDQDEVRLTQDLIDSVHARSQNAHAERFGAARSFTPDATEADDAERFPRDLLDRRARRLERPLIPRAARLALHGEIEI